jgi:hypothetical protein
MEVNFKIDSPSAVRLKQIVLEKVAEARKLTRKPIVVMGPNEAVLYGLETVKAIADSDTADVAVVRITEEEIEDASSYGQR